MGWCMHHEVRPGKVLTRLVFYGILFLMEGIIYNPLYVRTIILPLFLSVFFFDETGGARPLFLFTCHFRHRCCLWYTWPLICNCNNYMFEIKTQWCRSTLNIKSTNIILMWQVWLFSMLMSYHRVCRSNKKTVGARTRHVSISIEQKGYNHG